MQVAEVVLGILEVLQQMAALAVEVTHQTLVMVQMVAQILAVVQAELILVT
jgi:hypothetical protein